MREARLHVYAEVPSCQQPRKPVCIPLQKRAGGGRGHTLTSTSRARSQSQEIRDEGEREVGTGEGKATPKDGERYAEASPTNEGSATTRIVRKLSREYNLERRSLDFREAKYAQKLENELNIDESAGALCSGPARPRACAALRGPPDSLSLFQLLTCSRLLCACVRSPVSRGLAKQALSPGPPA